jgi:hypothetical protein
VLVVVISVEVVLSGTGFMTTGIGMRFGMRFSVWSPSGTISRGGAIVCELLKLGRRLRAAKIV